MTQNPQLPKGMVGVEWEKKKINYFIKILQLFLNKNNIFKEVNLNNFSLSFLLHHQLHHFITLNQTSLSVTLYSVTMEFWDSVPLFFVVFTQFFTLQIHVLDVFNLDLLNLNICANFEEIKNTKCDTWLIDLTIAINNSFILSPWHSLFFYQKEFYFKWKKKKKT